MLARHITDCKERADPSIPADLSKISSKVNGLVNGYSHHHSPFSQLGSPSTTSSPRPRRNAPFGETPAIVRTPSGMSTFLQLDRETDTAISSNSGQIGHLSLVERLRDTISPLEDRSESDVGSSEDGSLAIDGEIGEKRKLYVLFCHLLAWVFT
jgi:transcriptional activator SPT7